MDYTPEILAPAGSAECVEAAVRCGANAVYLGAKDFNARRNAENFSSEQLAEIIKYCHARGVKVHITLNTLVSDDEFSAATQLIEHICSLGADVLILQDIGLSFLAQKLAPDLERHASTQMSVQTSAGIEQLEKWGFKLAVLPREMTKDEIKNIRQSTLMRLEVFVHGALCMCVSGQCYLSAALGGRSGNRGLCAQPCRLAFSAGESGRHDLSLKDLSLIEKATELAKIGVDSFKIEGRMKRPEYVAASVTALKNSLEQKSNAEITSSLSAVFSRCGFTDGYYENKRGSDMFGTRRKQDVTAATGKVLSGLEHLYSKETARRKVNFVFNVLSGEPVSLSASCAGKNCFVSDSYIPEKAEHKPVDAQSLRQRLSKCGGTFFEAEEIEINLDDGLVVPASVVNSLRRRALDELEKQLEAANPKQFTPFKVDIPPHKAQNGMKLHVRITDTSQIPKNMQGIENLYVPLADAQSYVKCLENKNILTAVEIPRGIFGAEEVILNRLKKAKSLGFKAAYCPTIDALALAKKANMEIHTGFSMNIMNSCSVLQLEKLGAKSITLSPELTLEKAEKIGGEARRGIIAYGRLPLMLTRNCPIKNVSNCKKCGGKSFLTDRKGIHFPVVCSNGFSEVLNSRPIYMADRLDEIKNMDFLTLFFSTESAGEVNDVLDAYRKQKSPSGEFTRGLYYRGVD